MVPIAAIQHALKTPSACFTDEKLRRGTVDVDAAGRPRAFGGAFAVTWRVEVRGRSLAVRTPRCTDPESLRRLQLVQAFLEQHADLPLVPLDVQPEGLRIEGAAHPIVVMPWVEGRSFREEIEARRHDRERLRDLADELVATLSGFEDAGCAHGDLHPGNIFVGPRGIVCIDHGSMYVPALLGLPSLELGHADYNSPARTDTDFGPHIDRVALWILASTLRVLADDPDLWDMLGAPGRDAAEGLLFREADLRAPGTSAAFSTLRGHRLLTVQARARQLHSLLGLPLSAVRRPTPERFVLEAPAPPPRLVGWVAALGKAASNGAPAAFPARSRTLRAKESRS